MRAIITRGLWIFYPLFEDGIGISDVQLNDGGMERKQTSEALV